MNLEPVIGLEIHVQLKTKSKMFCRCANIFGDVKPNSAICPICLGYPGTLPVPNKTAIEWTQKAGAALNCALALESKFDRKSYFYPDLPKGYQISQYDQPFCGKGHLDIVVNGEPRRIGITRIHLEEDAAKNTHPKGANYTLVDYNRAGTPLMEIVTEPDIKTPEEARVFLQELQRIMRSLDVSDADMEKGQMRCDANISLREAGAKELHPKTEIKNVNSFKFVEKALAFEIKRQAAEWEAGRIPSTSSTRGFKSETGETYEQRTKEEAADYRYFPEPDIPPFEFTPEQLGAVREGLGELPSAKRARFLNEYGVSDQQVHLLVDDPKLAEFFEEVASEVKVLDKDREDIEAKDIEPILTQAGKMILRYIREILANNEELKINPENFAELAMLVWQGKVGASAVPAVVAEMQKTGGDPDPIIAKLGVAQVSEEGELNKFIEQVIAENPDVVEKIKAGKEAAIQFLMGQVMAKSRGTARADVVIKALKQRILGK